MLPSIVGPPLKGVADFKAPENPKTENSRDEKNAGSDSFGEVLGAKIAPKAKERDETGPMRERGPLKADKAEKAESKEWTDRGKNPKSESETKVEKITATNDNGVVKKTKGNSQREDAILKFMDSFESEFGVPPTRIVEAMAKLKATDQAESPEATVDQVIGQLDLDDQQEDQAKVMYLGLLTQLAQIDKSAQPSVPLQMPKVNGQVEKMFEENPAIGAKAQARFTSAQEKREALNQSLDNMNQKFWMKGANATRTGAVESNLSDKLAQMNIEEKLLQPQGIQVEEGFQNNPVRQSVSEGMPDPSQTFDELPGPSRPGRAPEEPNLREPWAKKAATRESARQNPSEDNQSPEAVLAALMAAARTAKGRGEIKRTTSEFEGAPEIGADEVASAEVMREMTGAEQTQSKVPAKGEVMNVFENAFQEQSQGFDFQRNPQQQESFGQAKAATAKGEIQAKDKSSEKGDFKNSLGLEGMSAQATPARRETVVEGAVAAAAGQPLATPTRAENEANVRQIMNQAQYLIKKGGGEMKVEMTPEGLGRVNLKVLVQDGKVNVQMAADTQEAKKTLESGLSDLKNNLAAHKLSMDHIKIDVVSGPNTDNSAQNQMNQNNPGSREQTRQFWNHFNENFGSRQQDRGAFMEIPSMRGYPRPRSDKGIEPVQTASVSKYTGTAKGKGLNLVA